MHAAAGKFKIKKLEPILEAGQVKESPVPWGRATSLPEQPPQTPKAQRIETKNHNMAFRGQHTTDLAQHLMGVIGKFERMRQEHERYRSRIERQRLGYGLHNIHPGMPGCKTFQQNSAGCIAFFEKIDLARTTHLNGHAAEKPWPDGAQCGRFGREQRAPCRLRKPGAQRRAPFCCRFPSGR